jgi:hypothetical protein
MDLIQFGGLEILQKIKLEHDKDEFLSISVPSLLKEVLAVGATAAIREISHEGIQLQLCAKCQETIERKRQAAGGDLTLKIPRSCDRVSRVLMFMENYPSRQGFRIYMNMNEVIFE